MYKQIYYEMIWAFYILKWKKRHLNGKNALFRQVTFAKSHWLSDEDVYFIGHLKIEVSSPRQSTRSVTFCSESTRPKINPYFWWY